MGERPYEHLTDDQLRTKQVYADRRLKLEMERARVLYPAFDRRLTEALEIDEELERRGLSGP